MENNLWYLIYLLLDIFGFSIFTMLFWLFKPRTFASKYYIAAIAMLKLGCAGVFFWLLLADLGIVLQIKWLLWLGQFPTRGVGIRLLLLMPGLGLLYGFKR